MGPAAERLGQSLSSVEQILDSRGRTGSEGLNEDEIVAWMKQALGAEHAPSPERYADRLELVTRNKYSSIVNTQRRRGQQPRWINRHLESMRSLRDVDEPAWIRVESSGDQGIMRRLYRG